SEGLENRRNIGLNGWRREVGELEVVDVERRQIVARGWEGLQIQKCRPGVIAARHGVVGHADLVPVAVRKHGHAWITGYARITGVTRERGLQTHIDDVA